jgi:hypothetical protein
LRYFKLYYAEKNKGRYCGKKPKQAANKAFSSIVKELNGNMQNEGTNQDINFSIRECTRNSKHKEYRYVGKREFLPKPVPVYIPHYGSISEDSIVEQTNVENVPIKEKKTETLDSGEAVITKIKTLHSGKEVTTKTGSVFLITNTGQTYKKITYHYRNNIQKAPKIEVVDAE